MSDETTRGTMQRRDGDATDCDHEARDYLHLCVHRNRVGACDRCAADVEHDRKAADYDRLAAENAALRKERDEALARWPQCTRYSNDCLGGCVSLKDHDNHKHKELRKLRRDHVCLLWSAALISEGKAAEMLGTDRVTARGVRLAWAERYPRMADDLEEMVAATDPKTVRERTAEVERLTRERNEVRAALRDAGVWLGLPDSENGTLADAVNRLAGYHRKRTKQRDEMRRERDEAVARAEALAKFAVHGIGCARRHDARKWQCSGCRKVFFGRHHERCPNCKRVGYWTGSVEPEALAAALATLVCDCGLDAALANTPPADVKPAPCSRCDALVAACAPLMNAPCCLWCGQFAIAYINRFDGQQVGPACAACVELFGSEARVVDTYAPDFGALRAALADTPPATDPRQSAAWRAGEQPDPPSTLPRLDPRFRWSCDATGDWFAVEREPLRYPEAGPEIVHYGKARPENKPPRPGGEEVSDGG